MYTRLDDIPILELIDSEIKSVHYNHVQVALKRLGDSIRYRIPKLKHLDLILEKNAWIIVDRVLNDIPIAAWTNFQSTQRVGLHEPVNCTLRLYHANARMILSRTLEAMELLLGEELDNHSLDSKDIVVPFPDDKTGQK